MPIEKKILPKEARIRTRDDGTTYTEIVEPWEITATGKEVRELEGAFDGIGEQMMHEGCKEWDKYGGTTITLPNGGTDVIRADKEHLYPRSMGFNSRRIRDGIQISGFGEMRRQGIRRQRISSGKIETWYADGRHTIEERVSG